MVKKILTKDEQEKHLKEKIGNPVKFKYPKGETGRDGKLLDRVVCFDYEKENVNYWNIIDRIMFNDKEWMRLSYYRYNLFTGNWTFAGQTSLSDPYESFIELFTKGIKEKGWLRPMFKEIYRKCSKELAL